VAAINPFQEVPEPQLAPNASPASKLSFFQALAKQKNEALERARTLYFGLEKEHQALRAKWTQLQSAGPQGPPSAEHAGQLKALQELVEHESIRTQEAEQKTRTLKAQIAELEEERKDLARALAEVEGQYSQFKQSMETELESRKQMVEELAGLKEELEQTQDQAAQLAAERADMAGQLEATSEGYECCVREAEQFAEENESLRTELEAYKSSFGQHQSSELHLMTSELKELRERVEASESEQKWLEKNLERSETRVQELEEAQAALQTNVLESTASKAKQKALQAELEAAQAELEAAHAELERKQMEFSSLAERAHVAQQAQAREKKLEAQLHSLQNQLEEARLHIQKSATQLPPGVSEELERLRQTVALLKKRLMVAEAAAEAAAGLKSKVARLESMLRQSGR
jgi:chromosome segregation ATPase